MNGTKAIAAAACLFLSLPAACREPGGRSPEENDPVAATLWGEGRRTELSLWAPPVDDWIAARSEEGWSRLGPANDRDVKQAEKCRTKIEAPLARSPAMGTVPELYDLEADPTALQVARLRGGPWVGLWKTHMTPGKAEGGNGHVLFVFKDCGTLATRAEVQYVRVHVRSQASGDEGVFISQVSGGRTRQLEYWYRPSTEQVAILEPLQVSDVEVALPAGAVCDFSILDPERGARVPLTRICNALPEYATTLSGRRPIAIYHLNEVQIADAVAKKHDGNPRNNTVMVLEPGSPPFASTYAVVQLGFEDATTFGNDPIPAADLLVIQPAPPNGD